MARKRQLRSTGSGEIDASLFNFEENSCVIDPEAPILLVDSISKAAPVPIDFECSSYLVSFKTGLTEVSSKTRPRRAKVKYTTTDPLSNDLYTIYHRRMEKEEKKMLNRDREKICSEVDKMALQLEQLKQNDWYRSLPSITYVRNPKDRKELEDKRKWTIESLEALLSRFQEWKRRYDTILGKPRFQSVPPPPYSWELYTQLNKDDIFEESDTDEEEDNMTIEQIRRKRVREKRKYGPLIKIRFNNKVLVAEPFKKTHIVTNLEEK